jgi:hypothetical protein
MIDGVAMPDKPPAVTGLKIDMWGFLRNGSTASGALRALR